MPPLILNTKQLTNGPNKLECYIKLGRKSLKGTNTATYWTPFISYEENEGLWIPPLILNTKQLTNGPNKLDCYKTLGRKGFPETNTAAYWTLFGSYEENEGWWIPPLILNTKQLTNGPNKLVLHYTKQERLARDIYSNTSCRFVSYKEIEDLYEGFIRLGLGVGSFLYFCKETIRIWNLRSFLGELISKTKHELIDTSRLSLSLARVPTFRLNFVTLLETSRICALAWR
jgi:hypothetical protein